MLTCNKIVLIAFILCFLLLREDKILEVLHFMTWSIKALWRQGFILVNVVVFCTGLAFYQHNQSDCSQSGNEPAASPPLQWQRCRSVTTNTAHPCSHCIGMSEKNVEQNVLRGCCAVVLSSLLLSRIVNYRVTGARSVVVLVHAGSVCVSFGQESWFPQLSVSPRFTLRVHPLC